ncbi:hypothetical protein BC830DRAFT_1094343 [Chytriomyces sp. MP71]|nr:hypothetical protein BC830DRAFT_1094343 [Chytriomyces sp. MP71]
MLRWFTGGDASDYAEVLSGIESEIEKTQTAISGYRASSTSVQGILLKYLGAAYALFLAAYFTVLSPENDTALVWLAKVAVVALFPVVIFYSRRLVDVWYRAKLRASNRHLDTLRANLKVKVEELKKKTGYYTTKNLIDKFDTPLKEKMAPLKVPELAQRGAHDIASRANLCLDQNNAIGPNLTQTPVKLLVEGTPAVPHPNAHMQHPHLSIESSVRSPPVMIMPNGTPKIQVATAPPGTPSSSWFDRVMDAVIGDTEGPQNKYALICKSCFEHNGLVPPDEYSHIKFKCRSCGFLNSSFASRNVSRNNSIDASLNHHAFASPSLRERPSFDTGSVLGDPPGNSVNGDFDGEAGSRGGNPLEFLVKQECMLQSESLVGEGVKESEFDRRGDGGVENNEWIGYSVGDNEPQLSEATGHGDDSNDGGPVEGGASPVLEPFEGHSPSSDKENGSGNSECKLRKRK